MNAYFISGLGADHRAFKKIKLPDRYKMKYIQWIAPLENESFINYCIRLSKQIDTHEPFILVGLSFGGIVATELTKLFHPVKSIIISSIPVSTQLPWYYKAIGLLNIDKLIPAAFLKLKTPLTFHLFGIQTKEEIELMTQILKDTDKRYLKWAIRAILSWRNKEKPVNVFHIHGTDDKILPIRYTQPDVSVKEGRHLMVLSRADAINEILGREL